MIMFIGNILNAIFCTIFIYHLKMGVDGAAICLALTGCSLACGTAIYAVKTGVFAGETLPYMPALHGLL